MGIMLPDRLESVLVKKTISPWPCPGRWPSPRAFQAAPKGALESQKVEAKKEETNRVDEGLTPPLKLPAPLAAAGVRGEHWELEPKMMALQLIMIFLMI